MPSSIVVYSANFGGYDTVQPVLPVTGHWVLFTDQPQAAAPGWTVRPLSADGLGPRRMARRIKTLAHRWFPNADYTIWLDANLQMRVEPGVLIDAWLSGFDLASFTHPSRDCVYAEAEACLRKGKDDRTVIMAQMNRYQRAHYPMHAGLAETRVVARHSTVQVAQFSEAWAREIDAGSVRDQLSFPVAAHEVELAWNALPGWAVKHPWFGYREHGKGDAA